MGAILTEPPTIRHELFPVPGETVNLRCIAEGTPSPNITLTNLLAGTGTGEVVRQTMGEPIDVPHTVTGDAIFECRASNYIVSASGEPEFVSGKAFILIRADYCGLDNSYPFC